MAVEVPTEESWDTGLRLKPDDPSSKSLLCNMLADGFLDAELNSFAIRLLARDCLDTASAIKP